MLHRREDLPPHAAQSKLGRSSDAVTAGTV
jgi:hypothetical protein